MSANPNPAVPAAPAPQSSTTLNKILNAVVAANQEASLIVTVAGVAIPLIKGIFVKASQSIGGQTVEYTVVLQAQETDLDRDLDVTVADVIEINAELARLNLPPLDVPPTSAQVNAQGTAEAARAAGTPAPGIVQPIGPAPAKDPSTSGS